ncbi:lysylphosphatidylglycerol synthase domain-containing protein [Psychroserpens sp.]|uniref:lysylphosphatidylglycerol synthase domain-containing protein n=1 Tax=Psychroserpens sp. TaxID=2020870 RepID=UPI001B24D3B0|nr:lysylphosphatidylglycerol synthase domain-containing protein [Psychroserpens sp.]MBO6605692.1 flippase-like domain-containing protein [Psychroserpens sp.]MBO6630427.1 flippase-like domain-containing protein [Psychroserpens sp.]MBO6652937.1 flippase-like domain-containing protein [Psychroserpens sp.]MBO6681291.1 flippase-like domain-containing protein [Psychroserpens sp.]MBO6749066.1 flippase-like domain-containing protein [Psychroserpens sp.]
MLIGGLSYKTKQFFFVLIKLSIVVGAFYFIYQKLTTNEDLDFGEFLRFLRRNDAFSAKNIIFLIILTIFNWFFEILKWKTLVGSIREISFKNAMEQSLGALTASLFTPNRIGEYGAKAIYFERSRRKEIMLLNLISNMMQMSVTLILGIIGITIMHQKFNLQIDYFRLLKFSLIVIVIAIFTVFGLHQNKFRIKGFSIERLKEFIRQLSKSIAIKAFVISFLRYLIFSFQFYILLDFFGVRVNYYNAMVVITSMYLISSIIPSIFIFDVVIKGSVAVYLFSIVGVNAFTTLSIITIMWLLNFVLPSIFGSFYVLNFNLPKTNDL